MPMLKSMSSCSSKLVKTVCQGCMIVGLGSAVYTTTRQPQCLEKLYASHSALMGLTH